MVQEIKVKVSLLPDSPANEDRFGGHERVAAAIAELIQREDGGKAIALEGGWGSGKSSIVRMLERKFTKVVQQEERASSGNEADNQSGQEQPEGGQNGDESSDIQVLVFDAWSHDGDPLRRVFLEELTGLCSTEFNDERKDHWQNRKKEEITGRKIERNQSTTPVLKSKWPILVLAVAALYPVSVVALGATLRQESIGGVIFALTAACALVAVAPAAWLLWLFWQCKSETQTELEQAGRLISLWSKKVDETTSTTAHETVGPTSIEFQSYFSDMVKEYLTQPTRRLVIVLDNLDRVPESTARTLWATLRLFADCCDNGQAWSKRIWFIVPYDRDAAAILWDAGLKQAELGAGQDKAKDSRESSNEHAAKDAGTVARPPSMSSAFFDKAFQIRFFVPPLHIADWEGYLNQLVEDAMPGFGSVDERHRVYRLSERLADEKGRPPSPRHLKLYVNDIGALARQFGRHSGEGFPIDHLALFTILRRQAREIRLWITSGAYRNDYLAQVMADESFVISLLCIYFGTDDRHRAATLTLGGPLRQHLRDGEGEKLRELAQVPGFWNVAENELERKPEDDEAKQEVVIKIANALQTGELHTMAPPSYAHVIPAFATNVLESAVWTKLNEEAAGAAEALLPIAGSPIATEAVFSRLVCGEPDNASVATESKPWAIGTSKLVEVARSLGHEFHVAIPGDAAQTVRCLASIGRGDRGRFVLDQITTKCPAAEVQSEVAPTADDEWSEDKSAALKTLHSTRNIHVNWNQFFAPISTRLHSDAVEIAETKRLLATLFDLCERLPDKAEAACGQIAKHASFYPHVAKWSKDACVFASLAAVQILSRDAGRGPSDPEKKGHGLLQSLFTSPEEKTDAIDEFVAIAIERPNLRLLGYAMDQRSSLGSLCRTVLTRLIEREDASSALPLRMYLDQFPVLVEELEKNVPSLTQQLLTSDEYGKALAECEVQSAHAAAHGQLIEAGALNEAKYRERVFAFLTSVNKETWTEAIRKETDIYRLLVFGSRNEWLATTALEDAVEEVGLQLSSTEPPELSWSRMPHDWYDVYSNLNAQRRGTAAHRIVDSLGRHVPADLLPVIALFGDDLAKALAEDQDDSLVRQIAEPIVKSGSQQQVEWLNTALRHKLKFWESAPEDDRSTFAQSLWQRVSTGDSDDMTSVLRQIADRLALEEPPPADNEPNDASEQTESGNPET